MASRHRQIRRPSTLLKAAGQTEALEAQQSLYEAGNLRYADLKHEVAEALVSLSAQFRDRKAEITADKKAVKSQIKASSHAIRERAQQTIREVKELCGEHLGGICLRAVSIEMSESVTPTLP